MKPRSGYRVLVLDADMVPALTISRSLARHGAHVDVGSHTERPLASYSRSVDKTWSYPNPLVATDDFVAWLARHTTEHAYDLVIPVTERTLVPLSTRREELGALRVAMPDQDSLDIVLDKARTMALAESLGVPVPGSTLVSRPKELDELVAHTRYPVVLKPSRSIGSGKTGASQLQVSYAFDAGELRAGCTHALRYGQVLLQELFTGEGVGIELIAHEGEVFYAFQHLRLHEVPLTGGGSSLRQSQPVQPELLDASKKLIAALRWTGVAMVEFKRDRHSGAFCLMEINGRFWGSLPLADAAGADFPAMLLDLEMTGEPVPCAPYRDGIYCRLVSRDLGWYEAVLRRDANPRLVNFPTTRELLRDLGRFFSPRHRLDVQKLADPLPGLVDIGRIVRSYAARAGGIIGERRFHAAQRRAWRRGEVRQAVTSAKNLLFLCYGNINRSALADALVRGYAEDSGIAVQSAGFHPEAGRPADPVMVEVARERGVRLDDSRSETVTIDALHRADVIFVMEQRHHDAVVSMDPAVAAKTYLLGGHTGDENWPVPIDDPYGNPRAAYEHCFDRIATAVDHLKAFMAMRPAP